MVAASGINPSALSCQELDGAIERGLGWLERFQRPDGEIPTRWSEHLGMRGGDHADSPFITGLVLWSLAEFPATQSLQQIRQRGLNYLLNWRTPNGRIAFLKRGIPPDLDDICLLHSVFQRYWPEAFDYSKLAKRVHRMMRTDGRFPTWLQPRSMGMDFDPVVNINVLRFLTANGLPCPETEGMLHALISTWDGTNGTFYYQSPLALPYFAAHLNPSSRMRIFGDSGPRIVRLAYVRSQVGASILDLAYLMGVLLTLGGPPEAIKTTLRRLLDLQESDGGWPNYAAFRAYNYWGSAGLSTALAIQAINAARLEPAGHTFLDFPTQDKSP